MIVINCGSHLALVLSCSRIFVACSFYEHKCSFCSLCKRYVHSRLLYKLFVLQAAVVYELCLCYSVSLFLRISPRISVPWILIWTMLTKHGNGLTCILKIVQFKRLMLHSINESSERESPLGYKGRSRAKHRKSELMASML